MFVIEVIPKDDPRWQPAKKSLAALRNSVGKWELLILIASALIIIAVLVLVARVSPAVASISGRGFFGAGVAVTANVCRTLGISWLLQDTRPESRARLRDALNDFEPFWHSKAIVGHGPLSPDRLPITGDSDSGTLLATATDLVFVPSRTANPIRSIAWDDVAELTVREKKSSWSHPFGFNVQLRSGDEFWVTTSSPDDLVQLLFNTQPLYDDG